MANFDAIITFVMLDRVFHILQQNRLLDTKKRLLLGVSGGPDSLCMFDILHRLELPLVVAHLNHRLRPESGDDARMVAALAEERGVPYVIEDADVPAYAATESLSLEEAARVVRYRFLFSQAEQAEAQAVLVAHTADDQVETVLMHFLRGAGLAGLQGMQVYTLPNPWSDRLPLVRPLLSISREEVLAYIQDRELAPVLDRSNLDTTIHRNRLRHELLPILETYNPNVRQAIWRMAQLLSADAQVIEQTADRAWLECLLESGPGYLAFSRSCLLRQPLGLRRAVARRAVAVLRPGLRDIDFPAIERMLAFFASPTETGSRDLAAGLRLLAEGGRVWLANWEADLPQAGWPQLVQGAAARPLLIPGELELAGEWRISARPETDVAAALRLALENVDPYQAWIDLGSLPADLEVRSRRSGDRFRPFGMEGRGQKLSDFLINVKMPRRARPAWPLVASGGEIVWVPGFRIGHPFQLKPGSAQAVHLRLSKLQGEDASNGSLRMEEIDS